MRISIFDDGCAFLLSFLKFSYLQADVRSLLTECNIVFIGECPPKTEDPSMVPSTILVSRVFKDAEHC